MFTKWWGHSSFHKASFISLMQWHYYSKLDKTPVMWKSNKQVYIQNYTQFAKGHFYKSLAGDDQFWMSEIFVRKPKQITQVYCSYQRMPRNPHKENTYKRPMSFKPKTCLCSMLLSCMYILTVVLNNNYI